MIKSAIKTLVVDDSKLMRKAVKAIISDQNNIQVVGEAANGLEALDLLSKLSPDVVVMDINMPIMDGLTALKHMMIQAPTPTVMLSTLTKEGADVTFDSLKYGAVDFIAKPSALNGDDLQRQADEITKKINASADVQLNDIKYIRVGSANISSAPHKKSEPEKIIAMGAAEGGYGTLLKLVPHLPARLPASYIIVLHAAGPHVDAFVRYLDKCSALRVKRAVEDEPVEAGVCYLCSGEEYVTIREKNGSFVLHTSPAPFLSRRGSINMLMFSVAELAGKRSVGVILSGEGDDGAEGLGEIIAIGGIGIVQSPENCLYKKMSETAIKRCRAGFVVSDAKIASAINMCCA